MLAGSTPRTISQKTHATSKSPSARSTGSVERPHPPPRLALILHSRLNALLGDNAPRLPIGLVQHGVPLMMDARQRPQVSPGCHESNTGPVDQIARMLAIGF
jgi:hypothetical protein